MRYQSKLYEAFIGSHKAEIQYAKACKNHALQHTKNTLLPRQTNTGNCLAPGYVPLSSSEMGELIAGMAEVYRAAAVETKRATICNHRYTCKHSNRNNWEGG
jgi:hypothetical protein